MMHFQKPYNTPRDKLIRQPLPKRTFEEAVAAVLHSPPTPEQRVKKEAAKARREERKRQKGQQSER